MQVLRQMVDDDAQDAEAVARLGDLYEEDRRLPELLGLRQEELGRTLEVERRLALRLEVDKIAAALEERSGRLEVLRANLEEQPGHWPTVETLARLLESRHRHADLVDLLTDQATRVEEREIPLLKPPVRHHRDRQRIPHRQSRRDAGSWDQAEWAGLL